MNVFGIAEYDVFGVVEYLHVADSFVVIESVVDVVPDDSAPVGVLFDSVGGVVSVVVVVVVVVFPALYMSCISCAVSARL